MEVNFSIFNNLNVEIPESFNNNMVIVSSIVIIALISFFLVFKWVKKQSTSNSIYRLNLISDTINKLSEDTRKLLFKACEDKEFTVKFSTNTIRTIRELKQVKEILFEPNTHVTHVYKLKKDVVSFFKKTYLSK